MLGCVDTMKRKAQILALPDSQEVRGVMVGDNDARYNRQADSPHFDSLKGNARRHVGQVST